MTPVIAEHGPCVYLGQMAATLLRMLALVALVMMPFGMTSAPAAVEGPHQAMAGMEPGHCDDTGDNDEAPQGSHCALACSMVAAEPAPFFEPLQIPAVKPAFLPMLPFVAHQPEADPPPPKLA